ncbi:MAG TPA: universal stress protein [Thermoanaerobaculia bacterium]|jgi:nucleotide-binding universal stress UspA family protein|nr:universal stress protein [Thermoanaerobaculia bacterium]
MKIMVATDGSRGSTAALNFAARLASDERGSELVVLTVDSGNGASHAGAGAEDDNSNSRSAARKVLDKASRDMKERGAGASYQVVTARRPDEVPEAISREADRLKADLVVVGSGGRDTLSEWVLGGTALRLIYVARRPVTVVRPPRRRKAS